MLDDVNDFIAACVEHAGVFTTGSRIKWFQENDLYCPKCAGPRRVNVRLLHMGGSRHGAFGDQLNIADTSTEAIAEQIAPALFSFTCLQCGTVSTAVLFRGPERHELAVFPEVLGGLATPRTPKPVAYYLDQAQRAENVDANSAAVAMYRAALEHLLFDQGYEARMLGPKIAALEKDLDDGGGPRWAQDLDRRFLKVINKLGNAAIHPGEDIDQQAALDDELIRQLKVTFVELLVLAYEREHEQRARLEALEEVLDEFTPPNKA